MTDLATTEAEKYAKVWADDRYRRISPGMMEAPRAAAAMSCMPGDTLNDYGCGTGRATKWWEEYESLYVTGIDHARNALETDVVFISACLWEMGWVPEADYGFCCDVMEHIPPEKVDAVLSNIADRTLKQTWFRIALKPDSMGPLLLGTPLHLTIQPYEWWQAKLQEYWTAVDLVEVTAGYGVWLCSA